MKKALYFFGIMLVFFRISLAYPGVSEELRYTLLGTQEAVDQEICGHDYFFLESGICPIYGSQILKVYFPDEVAKIVAQHVAKMEEAHNFAQMSSADFFHGHLILFGTSREYESVQAFLGDVAGIVYHTQEFTQLWESSDEPQPRSLLGRPDGSVVPAIQAVPSPSPQLFRSYGRNGSVSAEDIVEANPKMTRLPFSGDSSPAVILSFSADGRTWQCTPKTEFYLRPEEGGRFSLKDGTRYEIYFLCDLGIPL